MSCAFANIIPGVDFFMASGGKPGRPGHMSERIRANMMPAHLRCSRQ